MRPEDSPFPPGWWGTDLANVGLGDVRPWVSTYGCYDYAQLPSLPCDLSGSFGWLSQAQAHSSHIGDERAKDNARAFGELQRVVEFKGIRLPAAFTKFFSTPTLQQRIRSNTDCFLALCADVVPSVVGHGHLIRFLADSQGCIFWYVYLTADGSDHAVVASPDFYGTEAERWNDDEADPSAIVFSAGSFEEFLCRFWLENEIWFAAYEKTQMPELGQIYIERYRRGP
ncbi:hypothetical protein ACQR1I_18475 [Bradyrhizobium sp. HKCCYLS2038]|uniref:hypothetical protein n=1 Tax=unclassified Bradyrhizobium TaxID=2631580 RepID=UPI003EB85568